MCCNDLAYYEFKTVLLPQNNSFSLLPSFHREILKNAQPISCTSTQLRTAEPSRTTVEQDGKDRRPKSMTSDSYAKERKGNANKQFSYNKLVNERNTQSLRVSSQKNNNKQNKEKPVRPPQPRHDNKEGLLIDLSPVVDGNTSNSAAISATAAVLKRNNASCLLDEPIDVPTELDDDEVDAVPPPAHDPPIFRCPPPYQQPPQYSNLYEGVHSSPQKSTTTTNSANSNSNSNASLQANEILKNLNRQMYQSVNSMAIKSATSSPRPDPIGAEGISRATTTSSFSSGLGLSESLSQMSMLSDNESHSGAIPKNNSTAIDRNFLAELEKDIYKDATSFQVNTAQAHSTKDGPLKKDFSANSQTEMLDRIYAASSSSSTAGSSRVNNSIYANGGADNATTALIQQMWQESTQKTSNLSGGALNLSSSFIPIAESTTIDNTSHNFVAVSNRPVSAMSSHHNYNSVYGGSENYYSTVTGAGSSIYDSCPVPLLSSNANALYSNATATQQQQQLAMYDEVAGDELLRPTRPAPTVPPTSNDGLALGLSSQQIQRRIEKQNIYSDVASIYGDTSSIYGDVIENQKITAFCVEVGPDASVIDARRALTANNWDHRLAVRHFKVDQLMKLALGSRESCENALARSGWSVEVAASILLDK